MCLRLQKILSYIFRCNIKNVSETNQETARTTDKEAEESSGKTAKTGKGNKRRRFFDICGYGTTDYSSAEEVVVELKDIEHVESEPVVQELPQEKNDCSSAEEVVVELKDIEHVESEPVVQELPQEKNDCSSAEEVVVERKDIEHVESEPVVQELPQEKNDSRSKNALPLISSQEAMKEASEKPEVSPNISLPGAEVKKNVSEKTEVANPETEKEKETEKEEITNKKVVRIRRVPPRKSTSPDDVFETFKQRTPYSDIVEKIDKALDQNLIERRVVQKEIPSIEDFRLQSYLGNGAFGKVYKAQHRTTGKVVAIKAIGIQDINHIHVFKRILLEQRILRLVDEEKCSFVTGLVCSFHTKNRMCLAMDYAEGGTLASYVKEPGMPLERVRFYAACMVLGLQFLHEHNIVHRDMKPENVLLCGDGYIKITDYGLSEAGMTPGSVTIGQCGSAYYMAPEIYMTAYTKAVDWWALGVIIYELLTGTVPYKGKNPIQVFKIMFTEDPKYPEHITEDTHNLLVNLLKKDQRYRLGAGEYGTEDVKKSPFFEALDWEALEKKEVQPPFIPERRTQEQPETELKLKPYIEEKLCEETQWALEQLICPMSSSSDMETE